MKGFQDKVYLVTGATSGIGATTAKMLASYGAKIAITGRRQEQGDAVVSQITADGGDAIFIRTDVNVREDVQAMVAKTVDAFGQLDGAVNNAGIAGTPFTPTADILDEDWYSVINTNLNAVWMSMKFEIPAILANGGGAIVNLSSMYGLLGGDIGNAPYVASKFGVIGLSKTAAIDYANQGLRVNALCPGFCHSEMVDPYVEAEPEIFKSLINRHSAMNRLGESEEAANAIVWLLSEQSSFVNGAAIPLEGGETTRLY